MKQHNRSKGTKGEEIAIEYLQKNGFIIVETNFSTRFGEIDIIATDRDILVFVEVKLKVGENFGTPEDMITKRKTSQIMRTAEMYLLKNKTKHERYRIDAVCVVLGRNGELDRINHYKNIEIE